MKRWRWRCRRRTRTVTRRWARQRIPPTRRGRRRRPVRAGGAVPFETTTIFLPPPATALVNPNPLTTSVRPLPTLHRQGREHECVLVTVARDSFSNNHARIVDRLSHGKNLEAALRKIAKRIQVKHLAIHEKKCMLRVVAGGRRADDHSGGIWTLPGNAKGSAGRSAERA